MLTGCVLSLTDFQLLSSSNSCAKLRSISIVERLRNFSRPSLTYVGIFGRLASFSVLKLAVNSSAFLVTRPIDQNL